MSVVSLFFIVSCTQIQLCKWWTCCRDPQFPNCFQTQIYNTIKFNKSGSIYYCVSLTFAIELQMGIIFWVNSEQASSNANTCATVAPKLLMQWRVIHVVLSSSSQLETQLDNQLWMFAGKCLCLILCPAFSYPWPCKGHFTSMERGHSVVHWTIYNKARPCNDLWMHFYRLRSFRKQISTLHFREWLKLCKGSVAYGHGWWDGTFACRLYICAGNAEPPVSEWIGLNRSLSVGQEQQRWCCSQIDRQIVKITHSAIRTIRKRRCTQSAVDSAFWQGLKCLNFASIYSF